MLNRNGHGSKIATSYIYDLFSLLVRLVTQPQEATMIALRQNLSWSARNCLQVIERDVTLSELYHLQQVLLEVYPQGALKEYDGLLSEDGSCLPQGKQWQLAEPILTELEEHGYYEHWLTEVEPMLLKSVSRLEAVIEELPMSNSLSAFGLWPTDGLSIVISNQERAQLVGSTAVIPAGYPLELKLQAIVSLVCQKTVSNTCFASELVTPFTDLIAWDDSEVEAAFSTNTEALLENLCFALTHTVLNQLLNQWEPAGFLFKKGVNYQLASVTANYLKQVPKQANEELATYLERIAVLLTSSLTLLSRTDDEPTALQPRAAAN